MDGLLERDRELAALDRLIGDAEQGRGRVALIEGPAGIGKSRLLAEARARAAGMTVLAARCGELERDFSFGAVRQLLEPVADRERLLAGAAAPAAGVLEAPGETAEGSFAVLHGLYWAVLNLAEERPVLLAVDDLQWSDRPSLRFVTYLVRRLEGAPVLVAATLRSTEPGTDPALIAEIAADPLCEAVRPGPLGDDAVTELVTERLGEPDPRFIAACREATGGNPLLLRHLLAALEQRRRGAQRRGRRRRARDRHPRGVADRPAAAVAPARRRGRGRPAPSRCSARAPGLPAVAALTGLDEADASRVRAGELARADILRAETPLGFVHPLVRDVVHLDVPAPERELQHGRAAEVLAAHAGAARRRSPPSSCTRRAAATARPSSCCAPPPAGPRSGRSRQRDGLPGARAGGAAAPRAARQAALRARRRLRRDERAARRPSTSASPTTRSPTARSARPRRSRSPSRCCSPATPAEGGAARAAGRGRGAAGRADGDRGHRADRGVLRARP